MVTFLAGLAAVFATIAGFWNGIAIQISGLGTLGEFLSVGYYELSITFSNLAQLTLDGSVAAGELRDRIDSLQDTLGETLLESALGEAITSIWPTFPTLVLDPNRWVSEALANVSPSLAAFVDDPELWVLSILEAWLPIDIQASGFESMQVGGDTFYFNHSTPVGSGFEFTVPPGNWSVVWASFYGLVATSPFVTVNIFREGVLISTFSGAAPGMGGQAYGVSIASEPEGLGVDTTWRVLAATTGSMSFGEFVSLQPGEGEAGWGVAPTTLVGAIGPASWALDWSGFIDWLEEAFLSISTALYALLERILRYFWEGVY